MSTVRFDVDRGWFGTNQYHPLLERLELEWLEFGEVEADDELVVEFPVWEFRIEYPEEDMEDMVWQVRTWFKRDALKAFQEDDDVDNLADPFGMRDITFLEWSGLGHNRAHDLARGDAIMVSSHRDDAPETRITEEDLDQYDWWEWPDEFAHQKPSWASL